MPEARSFDRAIAIVGASGRFPDADDLDAFWQNLRAGKESLRPIPLHEHDVTPPMRAALQDPAYVPVAGILGNVADFDAAFFGITPWDAEVMDPQHRLFLECAYEALERAGCDPTTYPGRIGLYAGAGPNSYFMWNLFGNEALISSRGMARHAYVSDRDLMAGLVAYKLQLRGPSVNVNTTCSTSLVAVWLAAQALHLRQCDVVLAGGVTVRVPEHCGHVHRAGGPMSPDGHCRPFEARAAGFVSGSGAGVVVMKRWADAVADGDEVLALIIGGAVNNDGGDRPSFTAPSVAGQAEVVAEAIATADVDPITIGYLEAHGTATAVGDAIEVAALRDVFGPAGAGGAWCAIGSVKSNIGHLNVGAGIAGLLKAALALRHRELPPAPDFVSPNPQLGLEGSPFYVCRSVRPWQTFGSPRRAGVSAFGVGGTNAHLVLEEAPAREPSGQTRPQQLIVLSAKTPRALGRIAERLRAHLRAHPEHPLADVAHTLRVGRVAHPLRRTITCESRDEALAALETLADRAGAESHKAAALPGAVVFVFDGASTIPPGLLSQLASTEPAFAAHVADGSAAVAAQFGAEVQAAVMSDAAPGGLTPLVGALRKIVTELALAKLWMAWGVVPTTLVGHGLGGVLAEVLAGTLPLPEGLMRAAACVGSAPDAPAGIAAPPAERAPDAVAAAYAPGRPTVPEELTAPLRAARNETAPPLLLLVSPESPLGEALRAHPLTAGSTVVAWDPGTADVARAVTELAGRIWAAGIAVDWRAYDAHERRHRVPLPTYPFDRQRYWVDRPDAGARPGDAASPPTPAATLVVDAPTPAAAARPSVPTSGYAAEEAGHPERSGGDPLVATLTGMWAHLLGVPDIEPGDDFFDLGGNSLTAMQLHARIRATYGLELPARTLFDASTLELQARAIEAALFEKVQTLSEETVVELLATMGADAQSGEQ